MRMLLSTSASADISRSSSPVDGAQRAKSTLTVCTRCPSEPSIASASALSSQAPSYRRALM
jgi:hypothetical protein